MSQMLIDRANEAAPVVVKVEGDNLWLTQGQMALLFGCEPPVVTRHLRNVFFEGELVEDAVCSSFARVTDDGKSYLARHYNLEAIISVGGRVNSKPGSQFRQWANAVLHAHLTQGWTLDRARTGQQVADLEAALQRGRPLAQGVEPGADAERSLRETLSRYSRTFLLLQRYNEGLLKAPRGTQGGVLLEPEAARQVLSVLKSELMARGEAGNFFGQERDQYLAELMTTLGQTVCGRPAYATIESKAAHLLYFVIKNNPLADGNQRCAAWLFVEFLQRHDALMRDGQPVINDVGLAALTLLVAESAPAQKQSIICLIENMLVKPR